jgi:periplasmic protein TonB
MAEVKPESNMTLDDFVFANRNKEYGAYDLRKTYPWTATRSLVIGAVLFVLATIAPSAIAFLTPPAKEEAMVEVDLMKLPPPPIDPNEPPPPPPPPVELPKVNTVQFLPPVIKPDEEVPEETPPPTVEELKEAVAAEKTQEGDPNAEEVIVAPEESTGPTKVEAAVEVEKKEEEIFTVVEQQPEFPGGMAALGQFLGKNIRYPAAAQRANVSGRVFVSFVVNTDGSIQDVQTLKGLGFGTDEEAVRVVKSMPKWRAGKQSGRPVRVKYSLPINFTLE